MGYGQLDHEGQASGIQYVAKQPCRILANSRLLELVYRGGLRRTSTIATAVVDSGRFPIVWVSTAGILQTRFSCGQNAHTTERKNHR
jgi:hypothetical protein